MSKAFAQKSKKDSNTGKKRDKPLQSRFDFKRGCKKYPKLVYSVI